MSAAELRYMLATHQLGERGSGVRLTDIADRMGVTKVSVYRMSERLEVMGMMTRGAHSGIALTEKGETLLKEYKLCIEFVSGMLEKYCKTPPNTAFYEATNIVCAVGDGSRASLLRCLRNRESKQ